MPIKKDELLQGAVDYARAVLGTVTPSENIGKHLRSEASDTRIVSHYFESLVTGYPGWEWVVVLSRHSRSQEILVSETDFVAGQDALLAPAWVPWADRIQETEEVESSNVTENPEDTSGDEVENIVHDITGENAVNETQDSPGGGKEGEVVSDSDEDGIS